MKRHFPGLAQAGQDDETLPDGEYLVEVKKLKYRWHQQKPFYSLQFQVLEPELYRLRTVSGRLYCTVKALWKLNWFLTDFGYDPDLLSGDEIDEKAVVGLKGMLRLSHRIVNGRSFAALEAFAPADRWDSNDGSRNSYGQQEPSAEGEDEREVA